MVFITFEGIEGSGKTTQVRLLAEALSRRGIPVGTTKEPGGTRLANAIRDVFVDPENRGMSVWAELFLVEAARAEHVSKVIRPALEAGKVVLCDRFTDSTLAYQGYARKADVGIGLDLGIVSTLNQLATGGLVPDVTILLDITVQEGLDRIWKGLRRGSESPSQVSIIIAEEERFTLATGRREGDLQKLGPRVPQGGRRKSGKEPPPESRFALEPREFHERVREGYLRLAEKEKDRIKVVDASGDPKSVHLRVVEALKGSKASAVVSRLEGVPCH